MNVVCVVQARTGSTRLPGKVLRDLAGRPLLRFMLDRLAGLDHEVVVATSARSRDDAVAKVAHDAGRPVVRGSEHDVLARFVAVLDRFPATHVVRLTADCPLVDPALVRAAVDRHVACDADYTSNVFPRTFPKGLDVEVVRARALLAAHSEARDPAEREHVTPFLYRRPERFRLANVRHRCPLGDERWTVDTADDLEAVRALVARMGRDDFSWQEAWRTVGARTTRTAHEVWLAPAGPEHREFVLACRSDADAVRWSRSGRAITPEEHAAWFERALDDPGVRLRVAVLDGVPVGTARVDVRHGHGEVGVAVAAAHRGRGLGTALVQALVADCAADPQVVELEALVHPENAASLRAFGRAGFAWAGRRDGFRLLRRPVHGETGD